VHGTLDPRDRRGGLTPSRVTLATVAEALGVSAMTVSNAYNRPEKLSRELRERILAKADELGYAGPNALARSLRRGRTGALGVVLGEALVYAFDDPATVEFLRGLAGAGIALHLVPASGGEGDAALVAEAAVDAFVLYALPDGHPLVDAVLRRRLPVVVQSGPALAGHPLVAIDERAAGAAAAGHLRALGHTRLAVISLPFSLADRGDRPLRSEAPAHRVARGRLEGYGVTVGREVANNDRDHGEAAAGALLDGPEPPTGLLCMSDELAIGALRAAAARGLSVPEQLSVVGWDDTAEGARAELTTLRQSLRDQGRRCAELIAAGGAGPVEPQPWELIVRKTTAIFDAPVR
jgi:DNA-binding LacI/PurR family transcriptional regulator